LLTLATKIDEVVTSFCDIIISIRIDMLPSPMTPLHAFIDLKLLIFPVEDEDLPFHDVHTNRV
jgi:hypothetical protein